MRYYQFESSSKEKLSIGKLVCLAQTYKKHADEMNSTPAKEPVLFLKPSSSVIFSGDSIVLPQMGHQFHHEVEVGVIIGKTVKHIKKEDALDVIKGFAVCLDITARDIQSHAKKQGLPWAISKGFDTFAPLSTVIDFEQVKHPNALAFSLRVNDVLKQQGNTCDLLWSIEEIISYISQIMTLEPGDIILTGTPEGVGDIRHGDTLVADLASFCSLTVNVKKHMS